MTVGECGKEEIDGLVEGAGDPEKGELDDERTAYLEELWGVGFHSGLPRWLDVGGGEFGHCR